MGFIFYLLALTVNSMTGWRIDFIILVVGVVTIFYTMMGGLEAVIWTDVIQGFVIVGGGRGLLGISAVPAAGRTERGAAHRLGQSQIQLRQSRTFDLSQPTAIVLVMYGIFWYLQKYTADQTVVQRYLVAKSDRAAIRGVTLGAMLCVPVWTLFMLIGTCTWSFFKLTGEKLPAYITKADQVFPYFLTMHMPVGMAACSWRR